MKTSHLLAAAAAISLVACWTPGVAQAATQAFNFDVLNAAAIDPTPLSGGSNLVMNTLVTGSTGALSQSITFTVAQTTDFTGSAAWAISTAAGIGPRLIGVNIDIFDGSNTLVASDAFAGTLSGFATSIFDGTLNAGTYRLVATGTAVREASLDLSLSFAGGLIAPAPIAPLAALARAIQTDVLQSTSVRTTPLLAGDTLLLDTLVTDGETGVFRQQVDFTVGAGVDGFTGNAAWEITTAAGTGPRLVGVNIEVFDASDNLVASDTFNGTLSGFAFSNLVGDLAPGDYRLVATGTAVRDASLNVFLGFTGESPVTPIPEPSTYALMLAGLGLVGSMARRRASVTSP